MQDFNKTFGIIRSLLSRPSTHSWKRLCGHLDRYETRWDDPVTEEQLIHYVRQKLATWPTSVPRYAQHLWVTRTLRGEEVPQLELATAMQFISQSADFGDITTLFHNHLLGNMRRIDLRAAIMGTCAVQAIMANPWLTNLQLLDIRHTGVRPSDARVLEDHFKETNCQVLW